MNRIPIVKIKVAGLVLFWIGGMVSLLVGEVTSTDVSSSIKSVVVYPDRVLVRREGTLTLKEGKIRAVFKALPDGLDEDSLRSRGKGTTRVKILGLQSERIFLEKPYESEIRKLTEAITQTKDELLALDGKMMVLQKESGLVESIRVYSGEQFSKEFITQSPNPEEWEKMVEFMKGHLQRVNEETLALTQKKRELNEKLSALERQVSELSYGSKSERVVSVDLEALSAGDFDLEISYVIQGASWFPSYEARAGMKEAMIEFVSVGNVRQVTGEDWKGVELYLSTARPSVGAQMPKLEPWVLAKYEPPVVYQYETRAMPMMAMKEAAPGAGAPGEEELYYEKKEAEVVVSEAIRKGAAVEFKVPQPVDIPSDNQPHRVTTSALQLKGKFHYLATPKLSNYAYLVADVKNESDIQFLEGDVHVFLEGDFVGTSRIEPVAPGEEVSIHLGIDEGIEIKREVIKEKEDESGLFSKKKEISESHKIKIKNFKDRSIELTLWDQVPVSNHEDIVVDDVEFSEKPLEQTERGLVKWVLNIPAKGEKELTLHYRITHPRDMQVTGL